jgi:hypothetical protein
MPEARNSGPSALCDALRRGAELEALRRAIASSDRDEVTGPDCASPFAVKITEGVGTMWCAYAFAILALVSLPSAIKSGSAVTLVSGSTKRSCNWCC